MYYVLYVQEIIDAAQASSEAVASARAGLPRRLLTTPAEQRQRGEFKALEAQERALWHLAACKAIDEILEASSEANEEYRRALSDASLALRHLGLASRPLGGDYFDVDGFKAIVGESEAAIYHAAQKWAAHEKRA